MLRQGLIVDDHWNLPTSVAGGKRPDYFADLIQIFYAVVDVAERMSRRPLAAASLPLCPMRLRHPLFSRHSLMLRFGSPRQTSIPTLASQLPFRGECKSCARIWNATTTNLFGVAWMSFATILAVDLHTE